jgi:hypothetical protein
MHTAYVSSCAYAYVSIRSPEAQVQLVRKSARLRMHTAYVSSCAYAYVSIRSLEAQVQLVRK